MSENKGLARVKEIYENRTSRARELKKEGKKIIGYCCVCAPVEIVTALGAVPYKVYGDMEESVTEADRALPSTFCPLMRSLFDLTYKGKYDFLDGMVLVHSCDPQEKTAHCLESYVSYPYVHFVDIPGTIRPEAVEYFRGQLNDLSKSMERFIGEELSSDKLKKAIELHNKQRALVRELYGLRKPSPALMSGMETLQVMKALVSIPVEEGNELLAQVINEVKGRKNELQKKGGRLLIWSATVDDAELIEVFEGSANVVMDDYCGGSRGYGKDVKLSEDLVGALAQFYLIDLMVPRTFRQVLQDGIRKNYMEDLEARFGYLRHFVKEWNVNGVVLLLGKSCDPCAIEVPALKDYLDSIGVPSTYIEHDYTKGSLAPLTTRVEAFVEAIT